MKVNLNNTVRFKPTEAGKRVYFRHNWKYSAWNNCSKDSCELKIDNKGYAKIPLWEFMNIFGPMLYMGSTELPAMSNELEISE